MGKSSVIFPFNLEKAKRITEGKDEGKIVTRKGKDVRILCFDALGKYSIVALVKFDENNEEVKTFRNNGCCHDYESDVDLLIQLPIPYVIHGDQLNPFDKVLVRDHNNEIWQPDLFGRITNDGRFACIGMDWNQCIPYERNKHLLGTTNNPE